MYSVCINSISNVRATKNCSKLQCFTKLTGTYPIYILDVDISIIVNKIFHYFITTSCCSCHVQGSSLKKRLIELAKLKQTLTNTKVREENTVLHLSLTGSLLALIVPRAFPSKERPSTHYLRIREISQSAMNDIIGTRKTLELENDSKWTSYICINIKIRPILRCLKTRNPNQRYCVGQCWALQTIQSSYTIFISDVGVSSSFKK